MTDPRFSEFGADAPAWGPEPTRVSILGIASLVTGILSIVGCCFPALGLVPVGLGVGALVAIQRARGRLAGRGLAVGGLILGLISLVISTGLWVGAATMGGQFGPVYSQALSPDPPVVRSVLTASSAAEVSDEQIAEFQAGLAEAYGAPAQIPGGLVRLYRAYSNLDPSSIRSISPPRAGRAFPLPAEGAKGWFAAVVVMTERGETVGTFLPRLEDVGYIGPDGNAVWLLGAKDGAPGPQNQSAPPPTPDDGSGTPTPDPGD